MTADRNLQPTPDVVSVSLPAEYVEDFRAALVSEIKFEAECILGHAKEDGMVTAIRFADVRADARLMGHDVALFDQIEAATERLAGELGVTTDYLHEHRTGAVKNERDGDVTLTVEGRQALDSVPHVFEAMAHAIVERRLKDELGCSPIEAKDAARVRELLERAGWAVDRAAEWHAKADELRQAEAA